MTKALVLSLTVVFAVGVASGIFAERFFTAKDHIQAARVQELSDTLGAVTEALQRANSSRGRLSESIADRDELIDQQRRLINAVTSERDELLRKVADDHSPPPQEPAAIGIGDGIWRTTDDLKPAKPVDASPAKSAFYGSLQHDDRDMKKAALDRLGRAEREGDREFLDAWDAMIEERIKEVNK